MEDSEGKKFIWSRGYSHVKAYGEVPPKWVNFYQKSLDMDPIFVKKILKGSHFTKFVEKNVKSAIFEVKKPLEMGLDFRKFKKKNVYSTTFRVSKILRYG